MENLDKIGKVERGRKGYGNGRACKKKSYGYLLLCKQMGMEQEKSRLGEKGEISEERYLEGWEMLLLKIMGY